MRFSSTSSLLLVVSFALFSGCADSEPEPQPLREGSWGGPAELGSCSGGDVCEQDRWANKSEFQVIVWNAGAEVSSSDPDVLEIVSVERGIVVDSGGFFCFFQCTRTIIEGLWVIVRTKSLGTAEFVIAGPAGDQRRLSVQVIDINDVGLVDIVSDEPVDAIDAEHFLVMLDARDAEGNRLAVQGRWSTDDPESVSLYPELWTSDDASDTLEHSTTAFVTPSGAGAVSTALRVTAGDIELALPVEL
jgi:hypothetical protein